jgi:hypothetical protein
MLRQGLSCSCWPRPDDARPCTPQSCDWRCRACRIHGRPFYSHGDLQYLEYGTGPLVAELDRLWRAKGTMRGGSAPEAAGDDGGRLAGFAAHRLCLARALGGAAVRCQPPATQRGGELGRCRSSSGAGKEAFGDGSDGLPLDLGLEAQQFDRATSSSRSRSMMRSRACSMRAKSSAPIGPWRWRTGALNHARMPAANAKGRKLGQRGSPARSLLATGASCRNASTDGPSSSRTCEPARERRGLPAATT